jgi:hypothetical protein
MVQRTIINVKLYVHYLFCFSFIIFIFPPVLSPLGPCRPGRPHHSPLYLYTHCHYNLPFILLVQCYLSTNIMNACFLFKPKFKTKLLTWLAALDVWRRIILKYLDLKNSRTNILFIVFLHFHSGLHERLFIPLLKSNWISENIFADYIFGWENKEFVIIRQNDFSERFKLSVGFISISD